MSTLSNTTSKFNQPIDELVSLYKSASFNYYSTDEPILSDADFDELTNIIERANVDGKYDDVLNVVEHNDERDQSIYSRKMDGDSEMISLKKVQVIDASKGLDAELVDDIVKWLKRGDQSISLNTNVTVLWKYDGVSIRVVMDSENPGGIKDVITRGNVSIYNRFKNHPQVKNLFGLGFDPNNPFKDIRLEAMITNELFVSKYEDEYSNSRNLAAGIISDENDNDPRINDILFVPFNTDGINTIDVMLGGEENMWTGPIKDLPSLYARRAKSRSNRMCGVVPTDGLVVYLSGATSITKTGKYPHHAIAIKFPPVKVNTTVESIRWRLTKTGRYAPRVILRPVDLDGSTITKTSGFNFRWIKDNKICPGAIVEIGKNGDIVPYIQQVISVPDQYLKKFNGECDWERGELENVLNLPVDWELDDSGVNIYELSGGESKGMSIERFVLGCLVYEFDGFARSAFEKIFDVCDGEAINVLDPSRLDAIVNAIGGKKSIDLKRQINQFVNSVKTINYTNVLMMRQYPGYGVSTCNSIARYIATGVKSFTGLNKSHIAHFENKGERYQEVCGDYKRLEEWGYSIHNEFDLKETEFENVTLFEMTGSPSGLGFATKKDFVNAVQKQGWVQEKLHKGATVLVTDDLDSNSSKMKKAREMGIKIKLYNDCVK